MGKQDVRERIWSPLEAEGVSRFPGARGRIPSFLGAERAARRLADLPAWRVARVLRANTDSPRRPQRALALKQGKQLYMAVTREGARPGKGAAIVAWDIEMFVHDIPVDVIVTADETIAVRRRFPRPKGSSWDLLPPEKIEAFPVLRARRGAGGAGGR